VSIACIKLITRITAVAGDTFLFSPVIKHGIYPNEPSCVFFTALMQFTEIDELPSVRPLGGGCNNFFLSIRDLFWGHCARY
jgi:hypothetical protein